MESIKPSLNESKYNCEVCDFKCRYLSDYKRHISTPKHEMETKRAKTDTYNTSPEYKCNCGKSYVNRSGLWKHRRKCPFTTQVSNQIKEENAIDGDDELKVNDSIYQYNSEDTDYKQMFIESMKQNQELVKAMSEIIPFMGNTTNNNTTNNNTTNNNTTNNNNQFNLNFFLNEQCKDAIPLIDFVKSLQYDFDQLEYTGKHGFVEGVSKIIMDAMNELDITKRPIHCTDVKRETFYVKDDESWKKEDDRNRSIKTAIHNIRNRNLACVPEWIRAHPNCKKMDDPNNDLFIEIIGQYMDAAEKEFVKVIKTIAKSLTIPKSKYGRKAMCIVENSPTI